MRAMRIFDWLDSLFSSEPAGGSIAASSPVSDGWQAAETPAAPVQVVDWQNGFGTACDLQVPAESCAAYQSNDWSTFNDHWNE